LELGLVAWAFKRVDIEVEFLVFIYVMFLFDLESESWNGAKFITDNSRLIIKAKAIFRIKWIYLDLGIDYRYIKIGSGDTGWVLENVFGFTE
jgi:hypothetical protein